MLHLVFGNRLDALADEFVESARLHRGHALQAVEVAVPSLGVGRWLKYRVARACGVAAGIDTVYPAQVVWRLVEQALPQVQAASPVPGERLRWLIYQWLCDHGAGVAEVAAISREPLNRWQLAGRLARCFGDYLVFRPDWLQAWSKGVQPAPLGESAHARWQQALWQWLAQAAGLGAMRHPFEMYFALPAGPPNADAPPLHLFALPSLAPLYMDFFAQLAVRRAVHVYTLSPSREYWAQIIDARRAGGDEAAMGHPLLATWGKAQRDFQFTLCEQLGEAQVADTQCFTPIDGAHVLGSIQRAMLDLQPAPHAALGDDDRSITVHACHSLLRQTEVLHGALLDAFHRHPDWEPGDVVVLTPDLERLAPLVDAVFGNAPDAERLPYRITGLADRESAGLTEALLALLDPAGPMLGRFNVSAVMALLRRPAVAAAFDIGRDDLLRLAQWLGELGVHWGADASMRTEHGLPAQQRHTWAWGIARLLLGAVQPERALADSTGLLPHTALDGGELALVGRLTRVVAELQQWRDTAAQPASMASWGERIGQLLQRCFHPIDDATQDWLIACRRVLAQMQSSAAGLDAGDAVPAAMVRRMLADGLRASAPGAVPSGQISFARLGELRGLPYKGVYLLGIEGADFPRDDAAAEFDLLHSAPRRGDRSRRADDRGAFLDAMLAARDCFEVFCCGRDAATNDPLALA
ncbi:MAG: exodeoxyribonuclease V subunit gamma, partial [Betaproteobacteria bacterium]|nr:exodeoxyribonuclease V subunit gamma [Betaproteobacteria bacterium]